MAHTLRHINSLHVSSLPYHFNIITPICVKLHQFALSFLFSGRNLVFIYYPSHSFYMPIHLIYVHFIMFAIFCTHCKLRLNQKQKPKLSVWQQTVCASYSCSLQTACGWHGEWFWYAVLTARMCVTGAR
jgi:hypothetical protein